MTRPQSSTPSSSSRISRISGPKISGSSIPDLRRALLTAVALASVAARLSDAQQTVAPERAPSAPAQADVSSPSIVEGRVMKPAVTGEVPVPDQMVTVHRVGQDSAGPLDSIRTDRNGRYQLHYHRFGSPDAIYFAASVYRGIAYFSAPLRGAIVRGDDAEIVVFDTTTQPVRLTAQGHHIVISAPRPTGLRDVVEVWEISNDTVVTAIGRDSLTPVWSAPIPHGATGFAAGQGDVAGSSVQRRGDRVAVLAPFGPGVKQISYTYALPPSEFPLTLTLDRANFVLEVLLEEQGAQARAPSLHSQGNATTQGRTFKRFLAQNAPQGEQIRIDVPSNAAAARTTVVGVLAIVFAVAMLIALAIAFRRGRAPRPAREPNAPMANVDALAAAIASLDARREAGDASLSVESYDTERAALKARLASALAARDTPA